jgi:S1-C subfamily serine protease
MSTIANLSKIMLSKRESGSHPYILVLGAGSSVSSGTSLNKAVVERVIDKYDIEAFNKYLSQCSNGERFAILRDLVEGTAPSRGYKCLAELIRAGYFDMIISTNFDPLLEDAITSLQMRRRDYLFLINGIMEPDFIASCLDHPVPRVKLLKLHGDLFYQKFYYTGQEIARFPRLIENALETYLNIRDIIIVGHSMHDADINRCLKTKGSSIWYVSPHPPSGEIVEIMKSRKVQNNFISGDDGNFDNFFIRLRDQLLGGTAEVNVDEVAQSIFSVSPKNGQPVGSGFLLGDTGLIVTDADIIARLGEGFALGDAAEVRPFAGGSKRQAELVLKPQKELDYGVLRIQGAREVSPLQLADDLPSIGEPVTACISVGEIQGFRDGIITGINCSVPLRMLDGKTKTFNNLIETDIKISAGACGSPLIRKDKHVVGVMVAGNGHSYALTGQRLGRLLKKAGFL